MPNVEVPIRTTLAMLFFAVSLIAVGVAAPLGGFILSTVGTLYRSACGLNVVRSLHSGAVIAYRFGMASHVGVVNQLRRCLAD